MVTDGPHAVMVNDLRATYGGPDVVDGLSFTVTAGEMFGLIGPDGAGKTTTLRLLCGLARPAAGQVRVFGEDPFANRGEATRRIGYLSQRFSLYGDLSIDENIEFFARIHGVAGFRERRNRLLELVGLAAFRDRLADRLSGGMKQKLALACTLIHEPALIVLDEPTTGVDPVSRREFWKLLGEFLADGLTIVVATPYLDEAERCGHVMLIHEGRVLALDTPGNLRMSLGGVMLEVVPASVRRAREVLSAAFGVSAVEGFGDRLHVRANTPDDQETIARLLDSAGQTGATVRAVLPGLEDVFIERLAAVRSEPHGRQVHPLGTAR